MAVETAQLNLKLVLELELEMLKEADRSWHHDLPTIIIFGISTILIIMHNMGEITPCSLDHSRARCSRLPVVLLAVIRFRRHKKGREGRHRLRSSWCDELVLQVTEINLRDKTVCAEV